MTESVDLEEILDLAIARFKRDGLDVDWSYVRLVLKVNGAEDAVASEMIAKGIGRCP